MKTLLAFSPGLLAIAPWAVLTALGGQGYVVVITGMVPPGAGPEAFLIGPAMVAAHLLALVFGPPLLATPLLWIATRYIAGHVVPRARGARR